MKVTLIVFALLGLAVYRSESAAIRRRTNQIENYSKYLRTLVNYKHRLQLQGLYPQSENQNLKDLTPTSSNFNELEALRMIPVTIKQLRQNKLTAEERYALRKIFGNLWDLLVDESRRQRGDQRNPILSVLLNSQEVRKGKLDSRRKMDNDIEGNSIHPVLSSDSGKAVKIVSDGSVDPPQRLLRMVAAIVQSDSTRSTVQQKERQKRSSSINFENVKVTIQVPRAKRSLLPAIKNYDLLTAEEKRRVEEMNEAAIMAAVLAQIGNNQLDYDDDDEDEDYEDDGKGDVITQDTSQGSESSTAEPSIDDSANSVTKKTDVQKKDNVKIGHKTSPSLDYAYDENGGSDDYYLEQFKPRFRPGQFENPSVNELIMLAASHLGKKTWQTKEKMRH